MNKEELIIKYFESELSQKEGEEFQHLMEQDDEFRKEIMFRRKLKTVIAQAERKKMKTFLSSLDDANINETKRLPPHYVYAIAAAVVLLIAVAYLFYFDKDQTSNYSNVDILAFYEPYPNIITPNSRDESGEMDQQRIAFIAYETGNYQMADSLFTKLIKTDVHFNFYKGIAKFELEQYDSASVLFEQYLRSNNPQLFDQSLWYLSLTYLMRGEDAAGKENLLELKRRGKYKAQEVERLLLKL